MNLDAGQEHRAITVDRFVSHYLIDRSHPAAHGLGRRLDDVIETQLPEILATTLASMLDRSGRDIWLIRRLDVELDLDVASVPTTLARHWAAHIATALFHAMQSAGSDVVHFASPAAQLARFLQDLAEGSVWQKWYHRPFEGLRALPVSSAVRTALLARPDVGLAALLSLPWPGRAHIVEQLTAIDARRCGRGLATRSGRPTVDLDAVYAALLATLRQRPPELFAAGAVWPAALTLFLRVVGDRPEARAPELADLTAAVVTLARCYRRHAVREGQANQSSTALQAALHEGSISALTDAVPPSDLQLLAPLLSGPPGRRQQLSRAVRAAETASSAAGGLPATERVRRYTDFGGLFMLLPLLQDMPWSDACSDWPDLGGCTATSVARYLCLIKVVGQARLLRAFRDPLWRDIAGIAPSVQTASTAAWLTGLTGAQLEQFAAVVADPPPSQAPTGTAQEDALRELALPPEMCPVPTADRALGAATLALLRRCSHRLPGFSGSSPAYLFRNFLDVPARVDRQGDHFRVRLGRPPINAILAMTGLARARFQLSWLDGVTFQLFQES